MIIESLDATSAVFSSATLDRHEIVAESFVQLVAGTDTISSTLTWFFFLVATHPHVEAKLLDEIRGLVGTSDVISSEMLGDLPYLEATLNEAMRVLPAALATPWRAVPTGGRTISGHFLPEGVTRLQWN